ncbi:MAG: TonB-dependent receptor [Bacteroidota bacterium]
MKTFIFFMCTTVFSFSTPNLFSQEKVLIDQDQLVTVDQVFKIIKKQTNYRFIYPKKAFKNMPKVQLKKGEIELGELLKKSLSSNNLSFGLTENNNILIKKNTTISSSVEKPQEIVVNGTVNDANGQPLPSANILEKGTTNGTQSDFDGKFSLNVSDKNATIIVSYIGFLTKEVPINGQSEVIITLNENPNTLDDIVIVGYGTQRRRDLVGSISTVKGQDLELSSTPSVDQALQGKVAGLQITQNSAQPGGGLSILIRGAASINASNEPLIVVDGFPITDFQQPDSGNRYDGGTQSILNSFNPNDIASIEVLKDASATSIYGARAANGVILITTKKGKTGKVQVDFSTSFSFQDYNDSYEVLDLQDWMQVRNEAAWENWAFVNKIYPYSDRTLEEAIANPVNGIPFSRFYSDDEIRNTGEGTDWLSLVTRDGIITNNNLSVRGGTENTKYFLSANSYKHEGVIKNSGMERSSLRFNLDQDLFNDYVRFGLNVTMSRIKNQNTQLGNEGYEKSGIIRSALQQSPNIIAIDEFGNYPINPDNAVEPNPYSLLTISDEGVIDRSLTNFYVDIKPFEGFTARLQWGLDYGYSSRNTYLPRTTLWGELENGKASIASQRKNDYLFDFTLNYDKLIGNNHNLNALLGYSEQKFKSEGTSDGNSDFITDSFLWNNMNAGAGTKTVASSKSENNFISYFGRLNYVFKDRYIFTGTIRYDGSSVFAENNKYALFPSFAVGWNLAEESFMNSMNEKVSQLKFRFSHGKTGNADIGGNAFGAYYAQPAYLNPDESILIGVFPSRLENPDLKWETTTESNIGLDFELFNARVSGSIEVYNKEISDLLTIKPINSYHEINAVWANIGKTQSKGIELTLNTVNINSEHFKWSSNFVFSKFEDRWKERAPDWKPAVYESIDDPVRAQYSYLSDGIMQAGETVPAQPRLYPGQIKIKDVNGFSRDDLGNPSVDENGVFITTGAPDGIVDEADIVLLGSSDPDFIIGFTNDLEYRNFTLNFQFFGMFGREIYNQTDLVYGVTAIGVALNGRNVLESVNDRWTPENPSTTRPASHYGFTEYSAGDFFLQNASFIRLKNISLTYKLPSEWFDGSIMLSGQNLLTITDYDGVDPETDGIIAAYPNVKTYTIGVNLKF